MASKKLWLLSLVLLAGCSTGTTPEDPEFIEADQPLAENSAGTDPVPAEAPAPTARTVRTYSGSAKPNVQTAPFQVGETWLNGYTFSRGESWEAISDKIYGSSAHAEDLQKWNESAPITAGSVVYYNSPRRPQDFENMKVFAEDFGISMEEVEVKPGDSLSKIAHALYGTYASWKELAAVNPDLKNPDSIIPGMKLRVQPVEFTTVAQVQPVETAPNPAVAPPAVASAPAPAPRTSEAYRQVSSVPSDHQREIATEQQPQGWVERMVANPLPAALMGLALMGLAIGGLRQLRSRRAD